MTDAVADTTEFLQQRIRLLEQLVYDAERAIEDRDHTIDRQRRDLENQRRHAIEVDDYERPRSSPKSSSTACAAGRGRDGRRSPTFF